MKLKIKVTKQDIQQGIMGRSSYCPVALGTNRALTAASGFATVTSHIGAYNLGFALDDGDEYCSLGWQKTPSKVRRFILDYDEGKKVKPFNFTLEV